MKRLLNINDILRDEVVDTSTTTNNRVSWLIYYFGKKFEDKFLSVEIELGCPILSQKMDEISTAAIWQASNVTINAQRIIVRHLSKQNWQPFNCSRKLYN